MRRAIAAALAALTIVGAGCASGGASHGASTSAPSSGAGSTGGQSSLTTTTRPSSSAVAWPTYYGDAARSGASANAPRATSSLRRAWASPVLDGDVYAQPLVVPGAVVVATENDSVYALDPATGAIRWRAHLGAPVPGRSLPCGDVDPLGITGTPVVDPRTSRVYVVGLVAATHHELFALDLASGRVVASARVDAPGADPAVHNQRGALALSGSTLFVPYGGRFGDCGDYHGRVVAVDVGGGGIGRQHSFTLATGRAGGFWAPPGPTVAPDGSIFVTSGNSGSTSRYDYGNTVVHLDASLRVLDTFAPRDWARLNGGDVDIGSTGPVLLPGGRLFQIGKSGEGYLLDAAHLGGIGGELASTRVCEGSAFGGVAHAGTTVFVPCSDGVVEVTTSANALHVGWRRDASTPGPTVVGADAVWFVANGDGELRAVDARSGAALVSAPIGRTPSRFTSPAIADGRVIVAARRTVYAYS